MKQRLDQYLVDHLDIETRSKAQAVIMSGQVLVDDTIVTKAGTFVKIDQTIAIKAKDCPWVSRGGFKLAKAIKAYSLNINDVTAIDVGASTGGFTDVLLKNGAKHVYAVDVGHGQLDWSLRNHPQVSVLEKTNARYLKTEQIPQPVDMVVCDASFINLAKVLPAALSLTKPAATLIALIKPQFEAGNFLEGKKAVQRGKGVIKDAGIHQRVCDDVVSWLNSIEWSVQGLIESPITGPKGNKEFLVYATRQ